MSTRKYRLAAPIDNDKIDISHRSVPYSSPVWLPTSNNVCTKPEKALLHTKSFIPPARWWIVLPLLLLSVFIAAADPVITNDFIVRRYERQYGLDASPNTQRQVCRQSVSTSTAVYYRQYLLYRLELSQRQSDYALVQRAAAKLHTKLSVASLIPASCIGSLFFITLPVLRSKLTRMIEVDEYAIVFIGAGVIEVLGHSGLGIAGNSIYNASMNFFPGLVFIVFASIGLLPIALIGYLAFLERHASKDSSVEARLTYDEDMVRAPLLTDIISGVNKVPLVRPM
ncbi:unnamed protein product, partial [Adineta steineri]